MTTSLKVFAPASYLFQVYDCLIDLGNRLRPMKECSLSSANVTFCFVLLLCILTATVFMPEQVSNAT